MKYLCKEVVHLSSNSRSMSLASPVRFEYTLTFEQHVQSRYQRRASEKEIKSDVGKR